MATSSLRVRLLEAAIVLTLLTLAISVARAATCETENFVVTGAPTPAVAQEVAETAERCRAELAVYWLGSHVPRWREVCQIRVKVSDDLAPGGETSFVFQNGDVFGWEMKLQGSLVRLLDSVIPHEITHTLLAMRFRRPLPRWFDEGAATCMEHDSEKANYNRMLRDFLSENVRRGLPFNRMVSMMHYPRDVMPLYAQGFSVAEFLLEIGSPADYIRFGEQALAGGDWSRAARDVYGVRDLGELQLQWTDWVAARLSPTSTPEYNTAAVRRTDDISVYARLMEDPRTFQPITNDGARRVTVLR